MQREARQLAPGATFGKDFRVVRPLREGGMGAVYVAEQRSTGKLRALKVMAAEYAADPGLRKRLVREAKAASQVDSDSACPPRRSGSGRLLPAAQSHAVGFRCAAKARPAGRSE